MPEDTQLEGGGTLSLEAKDIDTEDLPLLIGEHSEEEEIPTEDAPEEKPEGSEEEPEELNLEALDDEEPDSDAALLVKPLAFVDKLEEDQKQAYLKQLSDVSKPIEQIRTIREAAKTDNPEYLVINAEEGFNFCAALADIANPETTQKGIDYLFKRIEERAGKSIEELIPSRFGVELDEVELELNRTKKENEELKSSKELHEKAVQWKTGEGKTQVEVWSKKAGGFKPDMDVIAPLVARGASIAQAVRQAHSKEWEKHLYEQGKKAGMATKARDDTTSIPSSLKGVTDIQLYPKGHPMAGQPIPAS